MQSLCLTFSSLRVSLLHQPVDGYFNIWRQMMFFRFIMGVGIGGEYPLSSSITSETSDEGHRGRNVSDFQCLQVYESQSQWRCLFQLQWRCPGHWLGGIRVQ
jgi:MFS family permease